MLDNKITLLGIIHFKKIQNMRSNMFNLSYLTSDGKEYKIKRIKGIGEAEKLLNITNGMVVLISGQILYSEEDDDFTISIENILPIKQRSGLAEETIILQFQNYYNHIFFNNIDYSKEYLITHPKPIPGNTDYCGKLKIDSLKRLGLMINKNEIID